MNIIKKALSLILAFVFLLSFPMAVSAIGNDTSDPFTLTQALVVSSARGTQWGNFNNWGANVVSNTGKILMLYGNKPIRSEAPTLCVQVEAADGTVKAQYKNAATNYLWFQGPFGFQNTGTADNPFVAVSGNMPTFQALIDSTKAGGANEGCKVYLYIVDQDTTMDGRVRGLHNMNDTSDRLVSNTTMDSKEAFRIEITDQYLTMEHAYATDSRTVEIEFSQPVTNNTSIYTAIRLVDKDNNLMQRGATGDGSLGTAAHYQWGGTLTLDGTNKGVFAINTDWKNIEAALTAVRKNNPDQEYFLKFCIEESPSTFPRDNKRGEYANNGFVDSVWGVDTQWALYANNVTQKGWNDGAYVEIIDAEDKLNADMAAATAGDTVKLATNVSTDMLKVPAGITLDLNGHTLTTPFFAAFGNVIDSTQGRGGVKISTDPKVALISLQPDNAALSVYDETFAGYRFFDYELENLGSKDETETSIKFGARLTLPNETAYELFAADDTAKIAMRLNIERGEINNTIDYIFQAATKAKYAAAVQTSDSVAITLTVYGIEQVDTISEVSWVSSPTGVLVED